MSGDPNFQRLVIENIIFDGNFTGQSAVVGPHFREGYKSLAVIANAKSGRIRNCMIRNFGAQGFMPGSLGAPANVESFQLLITGTDPIPQNPGANWPLDVYPDTHNWVIEDNEVSDLHFAYGGYCTAIVLNIPQTEPYVPNPPLGATPQIPTAQPGIRAGIVRRNVVRGRYGDRLSIGFGGANFGNWSGRVTFTDNLVMNANTGFNTDTGNLRELDYVRNFFLDVSAVGNLGVPANPFPVHAHYTVEDNFVRLRGRRAQQYYADFKPVGQVAESDPTLDLWRPLRGPATGLSIAGNCEKIVLRNNRFTTWPSGPTTGVVGPDNFLHAPFPLAAASGANDGWWLPNPHPAWETANFGANWWSLVVPYANNVAYTEEIFARSRASAQNVTLRDNHVSSLPYYVSPDTESATVTDSGTSGAPEMATLPQGVSENSAVAHTVMRQPLVPTAAQFRPIGFVGRAAPYYVPETEGEEDRQKDVFRGVVEVAIDRFEHDPQANAAIIRARVVEYRNNGTTPTYVWRHSSQYVHLQLLGGQTVPGAWPANQAVAFTRSLALGIDGFVTFRVTGLPSPPFSLAARVWLDGREDFGEIGGADYQDAVPAVPATPALTAGTEGSASASTWEEARDAWAEARLDVPGTGGNVVRLFTQPDVANEKSGKRAKLIFTRSGSTASALGVTFFPAINGNNGPLIRRGTYGTTGTADYYLDWSSATYLAAVPTDQRPVTGSTGLVSVLPTETTPGKVVFPAGSARVVVDVVARPDDVFERETAYFTVADGDGYSAAEPKDAAVILYDGPTWTLVELTSVVYDTYLSTYKPATAALGWSVNHEAAPKIAGWAQLPAVYGQAAYQRLGWWNWSGPSLINEVYQSPTLDANGLPLDRWHGLSTTTPTLVGQFYQQAAKWLVGGGLSYPSVQPAGGTAFSTTGGSASYGVSPNNTYMAGMATPATGGLPPKPMRWTGGTPVDLTAAGANFTSGQARGVDNTGLTVGWVESGSQKRGFRTSSGAILTADTLNPYVDCTGTCNYSGQTWNSWAYAVVPKINVSSPYAGYAVGSATWLKLDNGVWGTKALELATFWIPGTQPLAQSIGLLKTTDAKSRALSVNDFGEVVGWSGTSEWNGTGTVTTSKAFVSRGIGVYAPVSLNDKHFVHGLTGWDLAVASSINNQGWIVGIGLKNGQARGFLLRKLQP